MRRQLTAIIEKGEKGRYVALCPEFDIASQGETIEQAKANLKEAVSLFLECASKEEIQERFQDEIFVTSIEVATLA
ncbi:MAG TPA: type II toxin-antitoxin system HicB family antitoxin [Syntrophales bacterium]|nr:type II toxin-antitoxin system HicB family antitoxin [Syntrophales bacterium]